MKKTIECTMTVHYDLKLRVEIDSDDEDTEWSQAHELLQEAAAAHAEKIGVPRAFWVTGDKMLQVKGPFIQSVRWSNHHAKVTDENHVALVYAGVGLKFNADMANVLAKRFEKLGYRLDHYWNECSSCISFRLKGRKVKKGKLAEFTKKERAALMKDF